MNKIERFEYAGITDIGAQRESNQDAVFLDAELGLFGVSDGMGGLSCGEQASRFVQEALPLLIRNALGADAAPPSAEEGAELLRSAVCRLSDSFYEQLNADGVVAGATVTALWLLDSKAVIVSLGDSRAYLLRALRRLPQQLTEDMNLAALLVREGALSREEALHHPSASQLTAFMGMPAPATPSVHIFDVHSGDRFLLCTDGLYAMVEESEMGEILRSCRDGEKICRLLVERANKAGGRDNISVVYLRLMH